MNDENYVTDIANNLIAAVNVLLIREETATTDQFNLNEIEIQQLVNKEASSAKP